MATFPFNTNPFTNTTTTTTYQLTPQQNAQWQQLYNQGLMQQGVVGQAQNVYGTGIGTGVVYGNVFTSYYPPRKPLRSDAVYSSIGKLQSCLESRVLQKFTDGMILGWLAKNSPRHQAKMTVRAEAIRAKICSLREFVHSWEPGKQEA